MKFCPESNSGKFILLAAVVLIWFTGVILIFKHWKNEPFTLEISPEPSQGSLIRVKIANQENVGESVANIEEFLEPYANAKEKCKTRNETCAFDLKDYYPCNKENLFGYKKGTPCVFLKLTLKPNFVPEFYNETNLPELMPDTLKNIVRSNLRGSDKNSETVWISCDGRNPDDADMGPIAYLPHWNFPGFRVTCKGEGCIDPLVAVYFQKPRTKTTINVECKIWAHNIHDSINFNLLIE